jgi:hypothetical protein
MKRAHAAGLLTLLSAVVLFALGGCQAGSAISQSQPPQPVSPVQSQPIAVTVSPDSASVQVGMSYQFTALVPGDSANKGVTWAVGTSPACDCGTIDSTGKYLASKTPHTAPGLTITATSVTDPTRSGTAVIFVTPAPSGIGVFPSSATISLNGVEVFGATGAPFGTFPVVAWSITGNGCGATNCGTIDSSGRYTAPSTYPTTQVIRIKATSLADSSLTGFADIAIGDPAGSADNAKLNGHYAFLLKGYDGDGDVEFAGSFIADGKGNISGGVGDYVSGSGIYRAPNLSFTANYSVSPDNRASMTIASSVSWMSGLTFTMSLASFDQGVAGRGEVISLDSSDQWLTGVLARQDPSAFSTGAISGNYAFGFGGLAFSGFPLETAGRFTANAGSITAGHADIYGIGLAESGAGTVTPEQDVAFTGAYTVSANGRGTAVLNGVPYGSLSFYVVSPDELLFIEVEQCATTCFDKSGISGTALRQSGGPFSTAQLKGTSVFSASRWDGGRTDGGIVAVGEEIFDGSGNVNEIRDQSDRGSISLSTMNGSYSVDANGLGRGSMKLSDRTQPRTFYLVSLGRAFVVDLGDYDAGSFEPQQPGAFSNASLTGPYAMGTLPWDFNWGFTPASGAWTADGTGYMTGTTDSKGGSGNGIHGTYLVSSNGRTTITTTSASSSSSDWVFYLVSPSKAVGIEVTVGAVNSAARVMEK